MDVQPDPDGLHRLFVKAPELEAEFEVHGACPVQAFGAVRGRDLYFRARHGDWSFEVANADGNLPTDGYVGFLLTGKDPHYGYMPLTEAVDLIAKSLRRYLEWVCDI